MSLPNLPPLPALLRNRLSRRAMLANTARATLGAGASLLPLTGCAHHTIAGTGSRSLGPANGISGVESLRAHAAAKGLLTGCAVVPALLHSDPAYTALVREQSSILVAENAVKWEAIHPAASTFNFEPADALLTFAEQNHMKLRGHNLLWHRGIPKWFTATATPATARGLLETHIATVAGRYAGRMHSWDVVNEAIEVKDGRADGLRDSPWLRLIGDDYIEVAFRAARRADPQALLTYNDYGIEAEYAGDEAKRQAVLLMLRRFRARQVPIDAVGIQSHISAGAKFHYGPGLMKFIASVRDLDMQVFITEMDVNDRALGPDIAQRDAAVAAAYSSYFDLVLSDPAVTAVLLWGITDKFTWLNHEDARTDGQPERPLLFDQEYKPKQSFFATRDAFDRRHSIHNGVMHSAL